MGAVLIESTDMQEGGQAGAQPDNQFCRVVGRGMVAVVQQPTHEQPTHQAARVAPLPRCSMRRGLQAKSTVGGDAKAR